MKYSFNFKNKSVAKRFEEALSERGIKSEKSDEDGEVKISYALEGPKCENESSEVSEDMVRGMIYDAVHYIMQEVQWQMNWISSELSYIERRFWEHKEGHLPPINSPSQMQSALDALGISDDYEVQKKVIYASNGATLKSLK